MTACHRCSAPLGTVAVERLDAHWFRPDPARKGNFRGRRCPRCAWPTIVPSRWMAEEDLAGPARALGVAEFDPTDTDDPAVARERLRQVRGAMVARVRTMIGADPEWARFMLIALLTGIGPDATDDDVALVLYLQQVYAALLVTAGPVTRPAPGSTPPPDPWNMALSRLAGTIPHLSNLVRELEQDTVSAVEMRSGILRLAPSPEYVWTAEANLYRPTALGEDRHLAEAVDEVERQVYGRAVTDHLLERWATLSPAPGVRPDPARVAAFRLDGLERMVLTRKLWQSHAVPSFFFADERPTHRGAQALVVSASEADWLGYAPFLHGRSPEGAEVAVTTPALLVRAAGKAGAYLSGRLELATRLARERRPDIAGTVGRRAREVHARFEADAADACRSAGLTALDGLERIGRTRIAAGEIDVLAGVAGTGRTVMLVGECKNLDYNFFKDPGPGQTRTVLRHATRQVIRKRDWVQANWERAAEALGLPAVVPDVVGVVVTRTLSAPALEPGVEIVALPELAPLAGRLL